MRIFGMFRIILTQMLLPHIICFSGSKYTVFVFILLVNLRVQTNKHVENEISDTLNVLHSTLRSVLSERKRWAMKFVWILQY